MDALREYESQGYGGQFAAEADGVLKCFTCNQGSRAEDVQRTSLRRVEGVSEPDEMVSINALICPNCGAKGTAVFKYGPGATPEEGEVMRRLNDVHRSVGHSNPGAGELMHPAEAETPRMPNTTHEDIFPATPHTGEGPIEQHRGEPSSEERS